MIDLVIVGAGGHARVVADIARLAGFHIAGFLDTVEPRRQGEPFCGATVEGGLEQLPRLSESGVGHAVVAVGAAKARLDLTDQLSARGFQLPVLLHPSAVCAKDSTVGPGSVLAAGAIVNPGARIGRAVIVNTGASVDHDCTIEDGVHIAVGARLGGGVHVGRASWIGLGAIVKEGVRIGRDTLIGAGALVLEDVPDAVVAYGSPARVVRSLTQERDDKTAHV